MIYLVIVIFLIGIIWIAYDWSTCPEIEEDDRPTKPNIEYKSKLK